ncbi:MAG TPA: transaldolase [Methylovirgula sp.]|nr:transaldolase [Methylovirgula sp.]
MRRAVFLDRDGVLNRAVIRDGKPYPPRNLDELVLVDDARSALDRLKEKGFVLVCVSNQPDVGRGTLSRAEVDAINENLARALPLDAIEICDHDDAAGCDCRKPKPGMILSAAERFRIDLSQSFMVGDRWRDIEAGRRAGCRTILIGDGYGEPFPSDPAAKVDSLTAAASWIMQQDEAHRFPMPNLQDLKIAIFADGAEKAGMLEMYAKPYIKGFTTNPTLMNKAGIRDYEAFARDILAAIPDRPISFEVFADEFVEMERQARKIAAWGPNVSVKIPITNTRRESALDLIRRLAQDGIALNVTAIFTLDQVKDVVDAVKGGAPTYVSVFAGRIADTGLDPVPLMAEAVRRLAPAPNTELIWASPRELLNIFQADAIGCHVITVTNDILKKLSNVGKDLSDYSLETVKMFYNDGKAAGFTL